MSSLTHVNLPSSKHYDAHYDSSPSPSRYNNSIQKYRRTSRACDQCRKTKTRCDPGGPNNLSCRCCLLSGYECTFSEPTQKRGPPKGYLAALESRLHEAEALLGVIISAEETRARTLVSDLAKDDLANSIILRVTNSVFGPKGRANITGPYVADRSPDEHSFPSRGPADSRRQHMNSREVALRGYRGEHVFHSPSNAWQDYLCQYLKEHSSHICGYLDDISRMKTNSCSPIRSPIPDFALDKYTQEGLEQHRTIGSLTETEHQKPGTVTDTLTDGTNWHSDPNASCLPCLGDSVEQYTLLETSRCAVDYHWTSSSSHILGCSPN